MPLSHRTKIALAVSSVVLAVPVIAVIVLFNYDWNRAKPWLNERVSEAIARPFEIRGDLSLTWATAQETVAGHGRSWSEWLPWPHLLAKDVHVGNPETMTSATRPVSAKPAPAKGKIAAASNPPRDNAEYSPALPQDMASVSQFSFSLNPVALLGKKISIPVLRFEAPQVHLQRSSDGENNWTFSQKDKPSPWQLDLQRIVFTKGTVRLVDALQRADMTAEVDTINADPSYGVSWKLKGKYHGEPVSGGGKAGAVLSLQQQSTPFPIAAELKAGGTTVAIAGTLTKPSDLAALDMRLKLSGASMARLYPLTGLVLPETPPFSTEGHLIGELGSGGAHWVYEKFTGKVGSSDIAGKFDYRSGQPRARLSGDVASRLLQFSDLGPLIGADSNASKNARGSEAVQPSGRLLPVETFKTERWTSIDADVSYKAEKIIRGKALPISNLSTHFVLQDGVLTLTPLDFDIAGGKLTSNIKLDGSGRINPNAIRAELKASARNVHLSKLFPNLQALQASVGELNGDASLSATGNSVASLLGASNGEVKTLINQGTISKLLLEEMGLNIGNVVLSKMFGDKQVKLNCMATDFAVTNGLMQSRTFIVDTEEAVLNINGTVNLANERLDLTLKPDTKGFRVFSLRAPLYVKGTFSKPDVSVDKGVLALRAGGALALAAVAPVAALLPLVNTSAGESSGCANLLATARERPLAPPPGKTLPASKQKAPR